MAGNVNFDKELRLKKGSVQYRLDKSKAGRCGSSAGQPRPYAKQNMLKARLYSPIMIGAKLTLAPKHNYLHFHVGKYYECEIIEAGLGVIGNYEIEASEIVEHFIVKPKGKV